MDYAPARQALYEMRRSRERAMLEGTSDFDLVHEWVSINRYLKDGGTVDFFDKLKQVSPKGDKVLGEIKELAVTDFVDAQRYEVFDRSDMALVLSVLSEIVSSDGFDRSSKSIKTSIDTGLIRKYVLAFEISIAEGHDEIANGLMRILVELQPIAETFVLLSKSAKRIPSPYWVKDICSRASNRLTTEEFSRFERETMN